MHTIQLNVKKVSTAASEDDEAVLANLYGVDAAEIVTEFNIDALLDNYNIYDLYDYLERRREADKE